MTAVKGCTIRKAHAGDAPAVSSLFSQLGYPATAEEMAGRIRTLSSKQEYLVFVAEVGSEIVGLICAYIGYSLEFTGKYGRLTALVVDEKWRGRGIGKMLMEKVESSLANHGASLVVLTSSSFRKESHEFYRHIGYLDTGIRFTKKLQV
ncbi:MAG: GNAT family N-acetyltransferase [Desulfomonilia bacterium]|jgi:predicted N-acetyltransferase YhbS